MERLGLGLLPAPAAIEQEVDSQDENEMVLITHDNHHCGGYQQSKNSSGSEEMSGVEEGFMVNILLKTFIILIYTYVYINGHLLKII